MKKKAFGLSALILMAGCGPDQFANLSQIVNRAATSSEQPSCLLNVAQVELNGSANSMALKDTFGITIGFGQGILPIPIGGSASIQVSTFSMDMTMTASDPLSQVVLATSEVSPSQTQTTINAQIDFSLIEANPQLFLSSPLASVTSKGLASGLAALQNTLSKTPWLGQVLQIDNEGSTLIINAGSAAGVQVGDVFSIYNVQNFWEGTPCASTYYGSQHVPSTPVATVVVAAVSSATSVGTVTLADTSLGVDVGAQVVVKTLSGKNRSPLKKQAQIGSFTAQPFQLPDGSSVNLTSVLDAQIVDVVNASSFVY